MTNEKLGRVVWHDLFTSDRPRSMAFYERVADWRYEVEHSTNFAWGGGEKDFVLALKGLEAGAGIAEATLERKDEWIAYIEVSDVDAVADRALTLGGTVVRAPFEVSGVGRNCLLRDPLDVLFGICISRHSFPVAESQFEPDIYVCAREDRYPDAFYEELFGWQGAAAKTDRSLTTIRNEAGGEVAGCAGPVSEGVSQSCWMPWIQVRDRTSAQETALTLDGQCLGEIVTRSRNRSNRIIRDPTGAQFVL